MMSHVPSAMGLEGEERGRGLLTRQGVSFGCDANALRLDVGNDCTILTVLKATDMYTLKWRILRYRNFTPRRK